MDIAKAVKDAHGAGKLLIGNRSVAKAMKAGKAVQVVFASNCPDSFRNLILAQSKGKAEVVEFGSDSVRLGETCGKPFTVLVVGIRK